MGDRGLEQALVDDVSSQLIAYGELKFRDELEKAGQHHHVSDEYSVLVLSTGFYDFALFYFNG